jgi:hypothetical protein
MLFAHNGLASGPQANFFGEEKGIKVKGGRGQNPLDRIYPPSIIQLLNLGHLPEKNFFCPTAENEP